MARDRLLRAHLRERFIVTLVSGEAFSGLLDHWDGNHITLVDAYPAGDPNAKILGALFLPRPQITYMQRPGE